MTKSVFRLGVPNEFGFRGVFLPSGVLIGTVSDYSGSTKIFFPDTDIIGLCCYGIGNSWEDAVLSCFVHSVLLCSGLESFKSSSSYLSLD